MMYHLSTRIEGARFADVVSAARQELEAEGFGVLTEIDVQATLAEKLGEKTPPYLILGACNPPLAHRAIGAVPEIGVLLPCNVVVRQEGDSVVVDAMDPEGVLSLVDSDVIEEVARDVRDRLSRVVDALG